ncbi:dihydrofolate reductase [Palleniella muris]|uniref:Dihydrofolate reductase n=1 Tax=Palleniella muris TaxID=3038145 RepID=A0AC61QSK6_9BACT|nr:dihydrofolate reductase [Palleniella muris]TGX83315.1 dihydrofolate reductase [Palleniella muris]
MRINIIAAVAENRAIGYGNKLIYWLPDDLKRFKQLTTGHTIIMGRKTFESLPKGALPNRRNVVLSRGAFEGESQSDALLNQFPGCDVYPSLDVALKNCSEDEDVYIIGGASVYEQALPIADRLCLTEVFDTPEKADAFFPEYSGWREVWSENHEIDEKHKQRFRFVDYER